MEITKFHCHVYYDAETKIYANELWARAKKELHSSTVGTFHEKLVGPHLMWNFMIAFTKEHFLEVNLWLMKNRSNLNILVHADTGYDLIDHTQRCFWYGQNIGIDKSKLDPDPE